jgi:DUF1365 family protein
MSGASSKSESHCRVEAREAAASLYAGKVMHARLTPFVHRFTYRVFSLLIDIDRLAEADRQCAIFSVNRTNIVSFRESDHTGEKSVKLRNHVDKLLAGAGMKERARTVRLLCYPRMFGYVFNPLSVYFCEGDCGELIALIYEVRNTFGQQHTYVAPIEAGQVSPAGVRQSRRKIFHVSPFIEMNARYHFRVTSPDENVRLRIHETCNGEPLLAATFSGERIALNFRGLGNCLLKIPLMTWKVMAAIHWEALKLWLKGARFNHSPPAPVLVSYRDSEAVLEPAE